MPRMSQRPTIPASPRKQTQTVSTRGELVLTSPECRTVMTTDWNMPAEPSRPRTEFEDQDELGRGSRVDHIPCCTFWFCGERWQHPTHSAKTVVVGIECPHSCGRQIAATGSASFTTVGCFRGSSFSPDHKKSSFQDRKLRS